MKRRSHLYTATYDQDSAYSDGDGQGSWHHVYFTHSDYGYGAGDYEHHTDYGGDSFTPYSRVWSLDDEDWARPGDVRPCPDDVYNSKTQKEYEDAGDR